MLADDPLPIGFAIPGPYIQGKLWAPKYKGQPNLSLAHLVATCEYASSEFTWSGGGAFVNSDGTTAHGLEAYLKWTSSEMGTTYVTCSHGAVPPYGPGSFQSGPICVFDADLTSSEVSDANEETTPTFIGQDCSKLFTMTVAPVSELPTPPTPAGNQNDPHWVLTLGVENNAEGIAFYDATTGVQLTNLSWGYSFVDGYLDDEYVWHVARWDVLPGGLTPPTSVRVGIPPDGVSASGAPLMVTVTLAVTDWLFSASATDKVMVVPIKIDQSVVFDNVDPVRKLWYFGLKNDGTNVNAAHFSEEIANTN